MAESTPNLWNRMPAEVRWGTLASLAVCIWAFWPTLTEAARRWITDPQYSHGYLVPIFALVLLWLRRSSLAELRWGFHVEGMLFLAAGTLVRFGNLLTYSSDWLDSLAFVFCIAGIVVTAGGGNILRGAWPAIGFLIFMFPLPHRIERFLGGELQSLATHGSTGILQLVGLPAVAEGNVILVEDLRLGVAEACSGLGMLLVFVALGCAFAAVIDRPLLDRAILVASSVPIAVLSNVCRIVVTGLLHVWVGTELADLVFHDLAGWFMMPLALGLLWAEMKFLSYVLVEEEVPEPIEMAVGVPTKPSRGKSRVLPSN